jgi:DNA adenine methylase
MTENFHDFLSSIVKVKVSQIEEKTNKAKPFVKWVGGKRSIMHELTSRLPNKINNYYEPFVGGGALFFEIFDRVKFSYLSDLNMELVVAYNVIKNNPRELIELLKKHKQNHNEDYYYKMRDLQEIEDPIENSARFIYLLKTCFNGLYRVNKNGFFNTPIGSYINPNICDEENVWLVNDVLQNAEIKYQDFTKIEPKAGDFVYFDPPYHPINETSFVKYVSGGFSEKDQERLRDFALVLKKKGVNVMISNSDTRFINELYKDFNIHKMEAPRFVNCKVDKRGDVGEVVII